MFTSFDVVARGDLILKTSIFANQIMMFVYNLRTTEFELAVFQSSTEAQKYVEMLTQKQSGAI